MMSYGSVGHELSRPRADLAYERPRNGFDGARSHGAFLGHHRREVIDLKQASSGPPRLGPLGSFPHNRKNNREL